MSERVWNSGPPPHVGWWNADWVTHKKDTVWRWWNGVQWSCYAFERYSAEYAALSAATPASSCLNILWTDYWPENARVPRIAP